MNKLLKFQATMNSRCQKLFPGSDIKHFFAKSIMGKNFDSIWRLAHEYLSTLLFELKSF